MQWKYDKSNVKPRQLNAKNHLYFRGDKGIIIRQKLGNVRELLKEYTINTEILFITLLLFIFFYFIYNITLLFIKVGKRTFEEERL